MTVSELTNYQKVREFHKAFGAALDQTTQYGLCELRQNLIEEEVLEVEQELFTQEDYPGQEVIPVDLQKLAKELADLLYVVYGTGATFGIDLDRAFAEVHRSNMSKLGEDGKPIYREDGKVLKGPNYKPPTFEWITK